MTKPTVRWMEASDVFPMFPSLVWKMQLRQAWHQAMDAKMLAALARMQEEQGPGAPHLAAGRGWQSAQTLHELEEFKDLVDCIHDAANGVLRFLKVGEQALEITGCWATVLAPGGSHRQHTHPNNFLSGVYYVRTAPGADTINFHDPRAQSGIIRPPVTELTAENTDQVVVRVSNGTLLLFPSYLPHSVDANASTQERVSISFNIMFSSFTEHLSKPQW